MMEYAEYPDLMIHTYTKSIVWLYECIDSLYDQMVSCRETGLQGCSQDAIRNLQVSLHTNRDQANILLQTLQWTPHDEFFEEFKQRLRQMPRYQRPAFPEIDVIERACSLLSNAWNRLGELSNTLDRWPDINAEDFANGLEQTLHHLDDCSTIIAENNIFKCHGEPDDDDLERAENDEDSEPLCQDALDLQEVVSPDEEAGFLDLRSRNTPIDAELVYNTVLSRLRDVRFSLLICMDKCSYSTGSYREAKQQFWDRRKAIQADAAAVLEGLGQLYSHSDDFLVWFASTYGKGNLSHFDPSPAKVLLDAWADVLELVNTLKKRNGKIGDELGQDDNETTDDSPEAADSSSTDSFDLYEELNRRFARLYGSIRPSSDDDSDISPIFRRETFKDWLKRMIEGIDCLVDQLSQSDQTEGRSEFDK